MSVVARGVTPRGEAVVLREMQDGEEPVDSHTEYDAWGEDMLPLEQTAGVILRA